MMVACQSFNQTTVMGGDSKINCWVGAVLGEEKLSAVLVQC